MRCPFRYKRQEHFSFGVSPDYMDCVIALDDEAESAYNAKHPTCWAKFLHWLGLR